MEMDWKLAIDALQWLTTVAACVYAWLANRKKEITGLREDCGVIEGRVGALEQSQKNAPTHHDLHALDRLLQNEAGRQNAMASEIAGLHRLLNGQQRNIDLVMQHLLKSEGA